SPSYYQSLGKMAKTLELLTKRMNDVEERFKDLLIKWGEEGVLSDYVKGEQGDSLQYDWNGTKLGVKVEGDPAFNYTDLQGEQGVKGDDNINFSSLRNLFMNDGTFFYSGRTKIDILSGATASKNISFSDILPSGYEN